MRKKFIFILFLILSSILAIAEELDAVIVVGNQESYFEDNSSTSMKGEFKDNETPFSVSVTKGTLIEDLQAQRIEDTFDYTTGVTKSGKIADAIVIRGFDIDLQNVQVNGMAGQISRFGSPSTANVERIEILKGPASVLYGAMEPGGFVNIKTKYPQQEQKITLETSFQTYMSKNSEFGEDFGITTTIDATGRIGNTNDMFYRFIIVGEDIDSYRDNITNKNFYLYPSLLWNIDDNTSLLTAIEYGKENGSADDGLFVANHDISSVASLNTVYQESNDYDNDEGTALDIKLNHFINDNLIYNFAWRSVLHEDERNLYENRKVNQGVTVSETSLTRRNRNQVNKRDWHSFDTNLNFEKEIGSVVHNATAGISGAYRKVDYDRKTFGGNVSTDINIYDPIYGESATSIEGNRRKTQYYSASVYLQDKISLTEDFTLVASSRVDRTRVDYSCLRGSCVEDNTKTSTDFVNSTGLIYNLNDILSFYSSYGQSYNPSTAERVDSNGKGLDSEESEQFEVGTKININSEFNTGLSVYKINKNNVAEKNSSGYYELKGEVESRGFEADIQWLVSKNWQFKSGYAYNKSEYVGGESKGLEPANTPKITSYLFSRYNLSKKVFDGVLGFSGGIVYRDEIYTSSSTSDRVKLPSYTRFDMGIYYTLKDWDLSLNIENITDKEYFDSGKDDYSIYAGEPRKITFNFKKTF